MANVVYVRVSSTDQSYARQLEIIEKSNVKIDKVFQEKASAKDTNRQALKEMFNYIREGDTVYITEFSRLARSTTDLLNLLKQFQEKKVAFISLKENLDINTSHGKLMIAMLGAINEFERDIIRERQQIGIEVSLRTGKTKTGNAYGRPKKEATKEQKEILDNWIKGTIASEGAIKQLGLSRNTCYKLKKEYVESTGGN